MTVQDELLIVVLDLGLKVLMNHIGIDDEDTLGSSIWSFDDTTHGKTSGSIARKFLEEKDRCGDGGTRMLSMKLKSRRRSGLI